MSFFGETRNFGWVYTISELAILITTIVGLVGLFIWTGEGEAPKGNDLTAAIVIAAGAIVGSLITFIFALGVIRGEYFMKFGRFVDKADAPFGVLCGYLAIGGIAAVIIGVTSVVGGVIISGDLSNGIIEIVLGVLFLIIVAIMTDGKQTVADKIIFIILAILFILAIIGAIFALVGGVLLFFVDGEVEIVAAVVAVVVAAFGLLESLFITAFLFSKSTKKELGM